LLFPRLPKSRDERQLPTIGGLRRGSTAGPQPCHPEFRAGDSVHHDLVQVFRSFNEVRLSQDQVRVFRDIQSDGQKFHVYPSFGKKFPQMEFTSLSRSPFFVEMPLSAAILSDASPVVFGNSRALLNPVAGLLHLNWCATE
jgi:hypothetical protein